MSGHWSWFPPQVHLNTGRLCSAGSSLPSCSPTSSLVCSPPTPCPRRPQLRFPSPVTYLDAGSSSVPLGPTTRVPAYVPCVGDGSPALRLTGIRRGEARASQVTGPSSSCVPWSNTPPDIPPPRPKLPRRELLLPSGKTGPSASGKHRFRGRSPTAHTFACLRIAALVSKNGARLATGSGGLTLGRMGFAPNGRYTKFHGGIASSNPLRPTGPGRTEFPIRACCRAHTAGGAVYFKAAAP